MKICHVLRVYQQFSTKWYYFITAHQRRHLVLALTRRLGKSSEKFHVSRSTSSCLTLYSKLCPFALSFKSVLPRGFSLALHGGTTSLVLLVVSPWSFFVVSGWPFLLALLVVSPWSFFVVSGWPFLLALLLVSPWPFLVVSGWPFLVDLPWPLSMAPPWPFFVVSLLSLMFLPPTYLFPSLISLCCSPLLYSNATYVYPLNYNLIIFENT
jgi:hypothetical protein